MLSRRTTLLAGLATPFIRPAQAQTSDKIRIGTITPLTGAGGAFGPSMVKVARALAAEINAAGGVNGHQLELYSEDDETNPDAGVRAAHKLIDVNQVCAILGTWASSVTTAVAPLCWESKVMLFTTSGADSITKLPAQGYIIRTQPNSYLQSQRAAQFLLAQGSKKVFALSAQTPFAVDSYNRLVEVLKQGGAEGLGDVVYDPSKSSFRSEIDQALAAKPDTLFLNSYEPDLVVLMRELYRAGFDGKKLTLGYAANDKLIAALPADVLQGLLSYAPSPDIDTPSFKTVSKILGTDNPDPYSCQIYDHLSLVALSIAAAKTTSGLAIHDNVRKISQGDGTKVYSAIEGMKHLAEGGSINYEGASGPCDFTPAGDIINCKFRFDEIDGGHDKLLSIS
jgi:branched-chain amino acid transport system substrate-binding protein